MQYIADSRPNINWMPERRMDGNVFGAGTASDQLHALTGVLGACLQLKGATCPHAEVG